MKKDEEFIRESLVARGVTFPTKIKLSNNGNQEITYFGDEHAIDHFRRLAENSCNFTKIIRLRLRSFAHCEILGLLGLYGLEISACTGNARCISLIDMLSIPPLNSILTSFPWMDPNIRRAITRVANSKNAETFLKVYIENPAWQEEIKKAIIICLDLLKPTGIDSGGNLVALYHGQGSLTTVKFPKEFFSWDKTLGEMSGNFTVAVVTDMCLSSQSPVHGRRCQNGVHNDEDSGSLNSNLNRGTKSRFIYLSKAYHEEAEAVKNIRR